MNTKVKKAIVLLSGGLDSTTVAAIAQSENDEVTALSFDYNQRHRIELEAAQRVAKNLKLSRHIILPLDLSLFGGSSLTDHSIPVDHSTPLEEIGQHGIPTSYVPARNTVFLSLALACAEASGADALYIGANSVDYSGYPDCRKEFLDAFEQLANLATKAGTEGTVHFRVVAPILSFSKADIIRKGLSLGVDYSWTHTCYSPVKNGLACGQCESCRLRLEGFRQAGLTDPVPYANH